LLGHTVGITGHRRADELAVHLEALGADVLHGPVLRTRPLTDDRRDLQDATLRVIEQPPSHVIVTTGIGVRGWMNAAAAWDMGAELLAALRRARILARGPKAVGGLAEAGLDAWWSEPTGRTDALVDRLVREPLDGAHVAIQLPSRAMDEIAARLVDAGALVTLAPVYDTTWPDDLGPARRLVRAIVERRVAAVTFTSRPAVLQLDELAAQLGVTTEVRAALTTSVVPVCIGDATAAALLDRTGIEPATPPRPLLGLLAPTVAAELRLSAHHHVRAGRADIVVQGRLVQRDGSRVLTSEREAAVMARLIDSLGRTCPRAELLQTVWPGREVEPSVLETTVARLRRRLAPTGLSIKTVTGRGYLLDGATGCCAIGAAAS
jgi:uroporphyrinogen-III synthase